MGSSWTRDRTCVSSIGMQIIIIPITVIIIVFDVLPPICPIFKEQFHPPESSLHWAEIGPFVTSPNCFQSTAQHLAVNYILSSIMH